MSQKIIERIKNMRVSFGNIPATGIQDYPRLLRHVGEEYTWFWVKESELEFEKRHFCR